MLQIVRELDKRATILADSQDAASLPNSSPYAAFAMTDSCELQLERGALVLRGFDDLLAAHAELVPANDAGRRRERDGAHAHLTLLSKHETRTAAAALAREKGDSALSADASAVLAFARRFVAGATIRGQSILPIGLGRASASHFVVVIWPRGAALRARLGLAPADFHVTLGFGAAGDAQGVAKGLSTLTRPLRQPLLARRRASLALRLSSGAGKFMLRVPESCQHGCTGIALGPAGLRL